MKILITGAGSFIGKNLMKNPGDFIIHEVCTLSNMISNINFRDYNAVVHVAAIVHHDKNISKEEYFRINSDLAYEVARKAREEGVKHFLFMSTIKVYGIATTNGFVLKEDSVCQPTDPYAESKLDAEHRIMKLVSNDFKVTVIRTPLVYGPGVKGNMIALVKLINSKKIIPLGGIANERSITNVDNLVDLIINIISSDKSGLFIACDDKPISTTELILTIARHFNKKIYLVRLPKIFWNLIRWIKPDYYTSLYGSLVFDNAMTRMKLDYYPRFSTNEGIKKMVDWFKSNQ